MGAPRPGSTPTDAEQHADHHQKHVLHGQRDREAVKERIEIGHAAPQYSPSRASSGPVRRGTLNQIGKMSRIATATASASPIANQRR